MTANGAKMDRPDYWLGKILNPDAMDTILPQTDILTV